MVEQGEDLRVQRHQPRWYHRIIARAASSRVGAWLLSHTLHRMDLPVVRLLKGQRSVTNTATGLPIVTLTMSGAGTGKLRTHFFTLLAPLEETLDILRFVDLGFDLPSEPDQFPREILGGFNAFLVLRNFSFLAAESYVPVS